MRDMEHLLRVAGVFLLGGLVFFVVRAVMVPRSFGEFGHYRGDAIAEISSLPIVHAGHQTCESCHADIFEQKSKGKHAGVACEACHGAQAKHADDPGSIVPAKPDAGVLCAQCHEASAAKPKWFPQVVTADHAGGLVCTICHQAHSPSLGGEDSK
jgi:Cytochrome c554 and c-prime